MPEPRKPSFMKISIAKEAGPADPFAEEEKAAAAKAAAAGGVLGGIAGAVAGAIAGAAAASAGGASSPGVGSSGASALPTLERADEAAIAIRQKLGIAGALPIGIVLGSGLGGFADGLDGARFLPYAEVPHFLRSTVQGHKGRLASGTVGGVPVLAMQGRFHFYEGYPLEDVTFPIRVLGRLGVKLLILTNAAGGIGEKLKPGDLMLIEDHLNLIGQSPLRGHNDERLGPRFPDMSDVYPARFRDAFRAAAPAGTPLSQGVYAALSGPSYETPAEVRMLARLGADAVGMSTAPEAIVASHMRIPVLGISGIANMAAGLVRGHTLTHQEVVDTMSAIGGQFAAALRAAIPSLAKMVG